VAYLVAVDILYLLLEYGDFLKKLVCCNIKLTFWGLYDLKRNFLPGGFVLENWLASFTLVPLHFHYSFMTWIIYHKICERRNDRVILTSVNRDNSSHFTVFCFQSPFKCVPGLFSFLRLKGRSVNLKKSHRCRGYECVYSTPSGIFLSCTWLVKMEGTCMCLHCTPVHCVLHIVTHTCTLDGWYSGQFLKMDTGLHCPRKYALIKMYSCIDKICSIKW
jgi:hypothetical protein